MKTKNYSNRLILGYYCRLIYDGDSECYLISCDKFPGLLEDGMNSKSAIIRMRCTMGKKIKKIKAMGEQVPPMDNPDWEHVLRFTGHFTDEDLCK